MVREISNYLNLYLKDNDFRFVELIQKNIRKKTCVIKVIKNNNEYIIKAIDEKSPSVIKSKFLSEIEFYKNGVCNCVPKLYSYNEKLIILEFIEGINLRGLLLENNMGSCIFKDLFNSIESLYVNNFKAENKQFDYSNAYSHLAALALSGPVQTKGLSLSFYDRLINRVIVRFLKARLTKILSKIDKTKLKYGFVHGDLHTNNILVSSDNKVVFIDFENVRYDGAFDFDVLYLLAILYVSLGYADDTKDLLINQINLSCSYEKKLFNVYKLYRTAISINKRFDKNAISGIGKVSLLINIVVNSNYART